jgi:23S rRNA pseudouridine2605 synthase
MFESIGHPVARLRRMRIGPIVDEQIPIGHWRDLTPEEVAKLRRAGGLAATGGETSPRQRPQRSQRPRRILK